MHAPVLTQARPSTTRKVSIAARSVAISRDSDVLFVSECVDVVFGVVGGCVVLM